MSRPRGQVFVPNIPDLYFSVATAAQLFTSLPKGLIISDIDNTFIFLPPSLHQLNCNGTVEAIQYCFRNRIDVDRSKEEPNPFVLYSLAQVGADSFLVKNVVFPEFIADSANCESIPGGEKICCVIHDLSSAEQFRISSDSFAFGLRVVFLSLLAFTESFTKFETDTVLRQGNVLIQNVNDTFLLSQEFEQIRPILLFRLLLRK